MPTITVSREDFLADPRKYAAMANQQQTVTVLGKDDKVSAVLGGMLWEEDEADDIINESELRELLKQARGVIRRYHPLRLLDPDNPDQEIICDCHACMVSNKISKVLGAS